MRDLTPGAHTYSEQGLSLRSTTTLPSASTDAASAVSYTHLTLPTSDLV